MKKGIVFLIGANGYIGSSVAKKLIDNNYTVYGLLRDSSKEESVKQLGIIPVIGTLEDKAILSKYSKIADIVIHAADADHRESIETILSTLEGSGKTFVHTSGSSIVADDVLGDVENPNIFDEQTPFIPIPVREDGVALNEMIKIAGIDRNIRTIVIVASMIYGDSLGLDVESVQLPVVYRKSLELGKGIYMGKGLNKWSNVHISDLVDLYILALEKAASGSCFYAENGEESYKDLALYISNALGFEGETMSWKAEEALEEIGGLARYGLGSNSRIRAVHTRKLLGWSPRGESVADWISSNKYAKLKK